MKNLWRILNIKQRQNKSLAQLHYLIDHSLQLSTTGAKAWAHCSLQGQGCWLRAARFVDSSLRYVRYFEQGLEMDKQAIFKQLYSNKFDLLKWLQPSASGTWSFYLCKLTVNLSVIFIFIYLLVKLPLQMIYQMFGHFFPLWNKTNEHFWSYFSMKNIFNLVLDFFALILKVVLINRLWLSAFFSLAPFYIGYPDKSYIKLKSSSRMEQRISQERT